MYDEYYKFMDYDEPDYSYPTELFIREKELIGKVIIMTQDEKGPVFRKKGMRVLFVNRSCKISAGLVLVEDIILKDTFGFVIGRNIDAKEKLNEDDFLSLISLGYTKFEERDITKDKVFITMQKHNQLFDRDFSDKNNDIYELYDTFPTNRCESYEIFKKKYFLNTNYFNSGGMYITENIFNNVYFSRFDSDILDYFKDDDNFIISKVNINSLCGINPINIQNILISNANKNVDKLNSMNNHIRKIVKNLPRSTYGSIGKIASTVNEYILANNFNE